MAQSRSMADLLDLTQDELLPGLYNGFINVDEASAPLFAGAMTTDRPAVKFNRVLDEGTADYVGCDDSITPQAISGGPVSYDLHTINRSFDACISGINLNSSFSGVVSDELAGAISAMGKKLGNEFIAGAGGASAVTGLEGQIFYTVGQATGGAGNFDLSDLDALSDLVRTAGPKVMIGSAATVNVVRAELRAAGDFSVSEVYGTAFKQTSYNGIPILKSQYVTAGELHLVDLDQFKIWFGYSEDQNVGGVFNLVPVGALETKLRKRWHLYTQVAAVLKNLRGAASLTAVA